MPDPAVRRRAHAAYQRRAWAEARDALLDVDAARPLPPADLERLATAAHLTGQQPLSDDALTRAHAAYVADGAPADAARCAFWLAFGLMNRGEMAPAGGWLARGERLLEAHDGDCAERGYLMLPTALRQTGQGQFEASRELFERAAAIGDRCGDRSLAALARQGAGRALIRAGRIAAGMALIDDAMLAVVADEVAPVVAGVIYCSVVAACMEIFDVQRAQEWTDALTRWCSAQPDLVPFRGECLVHRSALLQLHGQWPDAEDQAQRATEHLTPPAVGAAFYQLAEVCRLRGNLDRATQAYEQAAGAGQSPHPGLALLWLSGGRVDEARAAIVRVLDEAGDRRMRCRTLPAFVEILLAAGDVPAARSGADELEALATDIGTPLLQAHAAKATGAVCLAEGRARKALEALRTAHALWQGLRMPYESARTGLLIATACREIGDVGSAKLEQASATMTLASLLTTHAVPVHDLTERETEVLGHLANGLTNKAIAGQLSISEKTVARHISNIFTKIDVSNRASATAWAFRHGLAHD